MAARSPSRLAWCAAALALWGGASSFAGRGPRPVARPPAPPAADSDGGADDERAPWAAASGWETDPDRLCRGLHEAALDDPAAAPGAIEACEAEAEARLAERRAAAGTLSLEELSRIPAPYRIPEEEQRRAALRSPPAPSVAAPARTPLEARAIALSAGYCIYQRMQREALAAAARARRQADRAEEGRRKEQAADYQRSLFTLRLSARTARAKLLACDTPLVAAIQRCASDRAACSDEARGYLPSLPQIWP